MGEWLTRAEINGDVVFFSYSGDGQEKLASEVFIWDLDKTYLDTKFETFKGLVRTFFEKAFQKRNVPGTATLVRSLKEFSEKKHSDVSVAIYFITASPPQLEPKIYEKLQLDGISPLGLFCKDNMQNIRPKRWWRLTKQVGYKLQALLQLRVKQRDDVRQILWGDDVEADAVIYSLYSDICARRLEQKNLVNTLKYFHVTGDQVDTILDLQHEIPKCDPVEKIYINLINDTDSEYYLKFGRRIVSTQNSFQTALDLYQDNRMSVEEVVNVAQDLISNYNFTRDEIEFSLDDLVKRQILAEQTYLKVLPPLQARGLVHSKFELTMPAKSISQIIEGRVYELEGTFEPWVPDHIDYLHDHR